MDFVYFHSIAGSALVAESLEGEAVFGLRAIGSGSVGDACRRDGHVRRGGRKRRRGGKRGMRRDGEGKLLGAS